MRANAKGSHRSPPCGDDDMRRAYGRGEESGSENCGGGRGAMEGTSSIATCGSQLKMRRREREREVTREMLLNASQLRLATHSVPTYQLWTDLGSSYQFGDILRWRQRGGGWDCHGGGMGEEDNRGQKGEKSAKPSSFVGGAAMILMNQAVDGFCTLANPHVLPASHIRYADGTALTAYIGYLHRRQGHWTLRLCLASIDHAANTELAARDRRQVPLDKTVTCSALPIQLFSDFRYTDVGWYNRTGIMRAVTLALRATRRRPWLSRGLWSAQVWPRAVTSFSSRGLSGTSLGILKPDISGLGVSILAAWPPIVNSSSAMIGRSATFNMISGTSMSTPHLSEIAALLRAAHPDWSPVAIKSVIMTTVDTLDRSGNPIMDKNRLPTIYFALGSGHVNSTKAVDPRLVYDLTSDDYVPYLCGLGYTSKQAQAITRMSGSCDTVGRIPQWDLNYPSMGIFVIHFSPPSIN
ncbi:hypothetical protein Taro_034232 [Colocasia esculenta]|uniref:Peptidase S8/S53 domain-containing protein n=1 Tax=Colocasia esculenta TaxID=4460 RepID=A0A843W2B8_COLES|nr:hypothetical protein [Colocasia esculenta]